MAEKQEKKLVEFLSKKNITFKKISECILILADNKDLIDQIECDAVVTDPPYGINQASGFPGASGFSGKSGFSKPIERKKYKGFWDNFTPSKELFDKIICNKCIIWGGNYFTDKIPQKSFWLVWDKENTMPSYSDCELAWTNINKKSVKRIRFNNNGCMSLEKGRFHPTQKPIEVMKWCISHLPKDCMTIFDPFMGSGTTLVACAKMGRKGIGIEIDEEYFNIACKRVEDAYKQPDIFGY